MLANRDVYYTPAWYRLKEYALARDGRICCNCGWGGAGVAHHLTYPTGHLPARIPGDVVQTMPSLGARVSGQRQRSLRGPSGAARL